jgi:tetratricopeptide (TPR) repeat protein
MLATFIENTLDAKPRAEVADHVSRCEECYAVVREVAASVHVEGAAAASPAIGPSAGGGPSAGAPTSTPPNGIRTGQPAWFRRFGAIAASLVVLAGGGYYAREQGLFLPPYERAVLPLVRAVGERRFFESRLVGGFKFGPLISQERGSEPGFEKPAARDWQLLAAAEQMASNSAPVSVVGAAELLVGDVDRAVGVLEEAAREAPDQPEALTNLAAAYLRRAELADRVDDRSKALEASTRALELDPDQLEALFNRALALEALSLRDQAVKAWRAFLEKEKDPGWRSFATERLSRGPSRGAIVDPEGWRVALAEALGGGEDHALDALIRADVALARDVFEREMLFAAARNSRLPATFAAAFERVTGDPYQLEQVVRYRRQLTASRIDSFVRGLALYDLSRRGEAQAHFDRAAHAREDPLALWSRLLSATATYDTDLRAAHDRVMALTDTARKRGYRTLLSRCLWLLGSVHISQGRYSEALAVLDEAKALFGRTHQAAYGEYVEILRAEALMALGSEDKAAAARQRAIAARDLLKEPYRRFALLVTGSQEALDEGRARAAQAFLREAEPLAVASVAQHHPLEWALEWAKVAEIAQPGTGLGQLEAADGRLADIQDPALRARLEAELRIVRGELSNPANPKAQLKTIEAAIIAAEGRGATFRLTRLLANRGSALEVRRDAVGAEAAFREAVATFEEGLPSDLDLAASAIEEAQDLYGRLIDAVRKRGAPPHVTFSIAERFHALAFGRRDPIVDVPALQSRIPKGRAIVAVFVAPTAVLAWVLDADHCLIREVAPPFAATRERAIEEALGRQVKDALGRAERVAVVAAPSLYRVSFHAALLAIGKESSMAPTATWAVEFPRSSRRGSSMVVGDPDTGGRFAPLPAARREAALIAAAMPNAVLLSGATATKDRVLSLLTFAPFAYLAGHAVPSRRTPSRSRLVLAGEQDLTAGEVAALRFRGRPAVLLAVCGAADGVSEGEGSYSLALSFLRAGASTVLASVRPMPDDQAGPFPLLAGAMRNGVSGTGALDALMRAREQHPTLRHLRVFSPLTT